MKKYINVLSVVESNDIIRPQYLFRPHAIESAANYFLTKFNGNIAYAVKANPETYVLQTLYKCGIRLFDVASIEEIKIVSKLLPDTYLYYMNPIKSRADINQSYYDYNVRDFSLDSVDELNKITQETNNNPDLNLFVRIYVPSDYSKLSLDKKFGAQREEAISLLQSARRKSTKLGISFHVGSQCMDAHAYRVAMGLAKKIIQDSKVKVDVLNVGGGFPSIYPDMQPLNIGHYFNIIHDEFDKCRELNPEMELMSEPGRALVAESGSEIVRVDLIKDKSIYINDGTYGGLFDAGTLVKAIYPTKIIRPWIDGNAIFSDFSFFGPTCDDLDFMPGPFALPADIREGEYFEIGQLGAYSRTLSTCFNGFVHEDEVILIEEPAIMSLYNKEPC